MNELKFEDAGETLVKGKRRLESGGMKFVLVIYKIGL